MRKRLLSPGFFDNPDLADLPPHARLLFAGLWCHCDRQGRCVDDPRRIRAAVFPYEAGLEIEPMLVQLEGAGFIVRYCVDGQGLIAVPGFLDHQQPHKNETASHLPAYVPSTDGGAPMVDQRPANDHTVLVPVPVSVPVAVVSPPDDYEPSPPPTYSALPECFSKFPTTKFDGVPIPDCIPQIVNRRFGMISPAKYGQFCAALTEGCLPACDGNKKQCLWCVEHVDYKVTNKPWKLLLMAMRSDREVVPPDVRKR